jgi:hypothetical protein
MHLEACTFSSSFALQAFCFDVDLSFLLDDSTQVISHQRQPMFLHEHVHVIATPAWGRKGTPSMA